MSKYILLLYLGMRGIAFGCHCMQAHGVIGNQPGGPLEVEQTPAVSLTLASFAATSVSTFSVTGDLMPDAGAP